ncbi:MAG: four helix bundle protein [Candidatus Peribacteria bacterium]|nr:MAG: four helix bundle protein [Candidatus Peribacteria bacterium]
MQEAQESCSRKDFLHRVNVSLKEAKETKYWLEILYQ